MKKTLLVSCILIITLLGCKNEIKEATTVNQKTENTFDNSSAAEQTISIKKEFAKFSWENIPQSDIDIGVYPFVNPPKGMIIDKEYSKTYEFDKLELFDGDSFFVMDGKVDRMQIKMEDDKEWQDYYFQKSIAEYLNSIGALQIFNGKIPTRIVQKWGDNPNAVYEHMHKFYAGDVVNLPVSFYVLKTPDRRIGFQVLPISGTIGVVEHASFKQTIEKLTADEILNNINTKGFAAVHINFDTAKSRIKAESYEVINEIVSMMESNPELKISIEGHTDNVGDETTNLKLSRNRARSVLISLIDQDIDESRLKSQGFGQTKPVAANSTEVGRAKNRRVELRKI